MDNVSLITLFVLSGLNETKNYQIVLFTLTLLCYCFIVLLNVSVIVTIILDKNLHEPMYILLCTFCMNGIYGTTGFYPKFLWDLLSPVHVISYSGCLLQALVMYSFASSDLSFLAVMAYDRYVAICRPLEYHSVMSRQRVFNLVCFSWLKPVCMMAVNIFLTSRLRLCSPFIARLFCVNWAIVKLACFPDDTFLNGTVAYITIAVPIFTGCFIIWSYMYLIKTCVHSIENRKKFIQTCVPHLTAVLTFSITILFDVMSMLIGSRHLPENLHNFISIEFLVIPPMMNPVIYGFKLTKIRNRILGVMIYQLYSVTYC